MFWSTLKKRERERKHLYVHFDLLSAFEGYRQQPEKRLENDDFSQRSIISLGWQPSSV